MAVELVIPRSGESINEVQIGAWRKKEGDTVTQDEVLVEIETDKASMDLPAPVSGRISKLLKKQGEVAHVGDVIAYIEEGGAGASGSVSAATAQRAEHVVGDQAPQPAGQDVEVKPRDGAANAKPAAAAKATEPAKPAPARTAPPAKSEATVMPAARRELAQAGLTPDQVEGSGPGGRILKGDAHKAPPVDRGAAPGAGDRGDREEVVPMSMLRKRIAKRLVEAQQTAALLTTFNEVDMTAVIKMRQDYQKSFTEKHGIKLGFMSFFVKAAVSALQRIPEINAEIRGDTIVYHNYYDIGVAVSSEKGLVVPVLRDADGMSFAQIEKAIEEVARKARENKLTVEDLTGGTFTISNGGIFGSMLSTPIVNPPQSGILGLHAIQERPVVRDGQIVAHSMMYLALTYDHRIVDGKGAVTFLKHIKEVVEDPARLLFEV